MLTESTVETMFRQLIAIAKGEPVGSAEDTLDKASELLEDELRPESPLLHRLSIELEEIRVRLATRAVNDGGGIATGGRSDFLPRAESKSISDSLSPRERLSIREFQTQVELTFDADVTESVCNLICGEFEDAILHAGGEFLWEDE